MGNLVSARENEIARNANEEENGDETAENEVTNDYHKREWNNPADAPKYGVLRYKGLVYVRESVLELDGIAKMGIRDDDIWVCSFPRSGTTMTQELVYLIQTLDFEKANSLLLDARFPMIDLLLDGVPYYGGLKMIENLPSPRFVKTHLQHFLLPEQLRSGKGKIIYTARNLPDTLWSLYNFTELITMRKSPFGKYFKRFMDGREPWTPWGRHVREFWDQRNDENVLFLKFEDTVEDMAGTVRRIAEFLGRELSEENVKKICDHCSIENMKKNEMTNGDYFVDVADFEMAPDHGGLINSGKGGGWRDHVTDEMHALMKGEMEKYFSGSGLTFKHM